MPAGLEEFNEETQREKVGMAFKGGPFFKNPMTHPPMSIVDAVPEEVKQKSFFSGITEGTPTTPWNASRQAGK